MTASTLRAALAAAVSAWALSAAMPALAQDRLVNMIPQNRSGETNQDSEPTLTIDPADYNRIAGSAFTWDNLNQGPMTTNTAPIYVSQDRGATWTMAFTVPSLIGNSFPTSDINLHFGSTLSGAPGHETSWLYGGILRATATGYPMAVLRTPDYLDPAVMTVLDTRTGNVDQPHVEALSSFGGEDKLYVGFNNGWGCLTIPNGRTATLDVSQSASVAAPAFTLDLIQARDTNCQDGFAQVPAAHLDGTVYAAFIGSWASSPRIIVVRDDAWGASASPFAALTNTPGDGVAGQFVTPAITLQSGNMGQQRLGASNLSIAVDPNNSSRVYLAYGDRGGPNSETIHVRHSNDRGVTWPDGDLLTVTNAMNPEVAINSLGTVGVLYQRVNAGRWETRLARSTNAAGTTFDGGLLLANTNASSPSNTFASAVYVGDYASLRAVGKSFMGMFSASNYPDTSTFLAGVSFQRYADWGTHVLYADAAHTTVVPLSIDPYYFEAAGIAPELDYYVRDWTNDATHADTGAEPSTNPVFYATSDVWNRRSPSGPGPFVSDQPTNEDAGNGAGNIGDNWAFARVRRNVAGSASLITAHFLVSKFGTGSNYADATSGPVTEPDISFPDPDPIIPGDATIGPWITVPYHWHLNAIAGNHLCLAVEISAPGSGYIPPSLVGQTPGWPTTDLRIVNDNHKAQRNMHLSTTPGDGGAGGSVTDYAIIHNGALATRDVTLKVGVSGLSRRYVRSGRVQDIDPAHRNDTAGIGQTMVLKGMQPGENRWVAVTVETAGLPDGQDAYLTVDDMVGSIPVNGFGVGVRAAGPDQTVQASLDVYRGVASRLQAGFGAGQSATDIKPSYEVTPAVYGGFVHVRMVPHLKADLAKSGASGPSDPFGLDARLAEIASERPGPALVGHVASLMNAIDARLTTLQLQKGDAADIMQMVRWQQQLFAREPRLARLPCTPKLLEASRAFLNARATGKTTNQEGYPRLIEMTGACLREAAGGGPELKGSDITALEKAHRGYLLALSK